jgi:hypothetical protein
VGSARRRRRQRQRRMTALANRAAEPAECAKNNDGSAS